MSTIISALLIVISTVGILLIFILIGKKKKKQNETFLKLFSQDDIRQGLSFASQEVLGNKIIGLDGINKKRLMFSLNSTEHIRIAMEEVRNCTVERKFESVIVGGAKKAITEKYLDRIYLQLGFKNNAEPVSIPFYESGVNNIYEMAELETKAKTWQELLSKMIIKEKGRV